MISSANPASPTDSRSQETRARIFSVTLDLIDRHGADNLTVRRIAEASDVSPALIIQYFGSKERLLQQVFDLKTTALLEELRDWIGSDENAGTLDCLMWVADRLLERDLSSPHLTLQVLAYSFRWDEAEEKVFFARTEPMIDLFTRCLMKSGHISTRKQARDGVWTFFLCYLQAVRIILQRGMTKDEGLRLLKRPLTIIAMGLEHHQPAAERGGRGG